MFCPYCGAHLVDGAKFCNTCGKGIEWPDQPKEENQTLTQEEFAAYQAQKEAEEKAEYEGWKKSRAAAFEAQQAQPTYVEPFPAKEAYTETQQTATTAQVPSETEQEMSKSAMILAIIGAALAEFGLPGLIVTLIAKKKVNQILEHFGKLRGKAIAARWISFGGFIGSIILTVFWAFYFLVIFVAIVGAIKYGA